MAYFTNSDPKNRMQLIVSGGGAHSMTDLVFSAGLADAQTFRQGAQVCLNHDRAIQAGLEFHTSMPLFAINGTDEMDVGQYAYNLQKDIVGHGHGVVNTLPATGGYELMTTEYNDEGFDIETDYVPGCTLLTNDVSTVVSALVSLPNALASIALVSAWARRSFCASGRCGGAQSIPLALVPAATVPSKL
jgi:hypothetical protein